MWNIVASVVKNIKLKVRVKIGRDEVSGWSDWLIFPTDGYGEISSYGPFRIRDVSFLEIDPVKVISVGRLVPDRKVDKRGELEKILKEERVAFIIVDGLFRISERL